ncbi:MAG: 3-deoxy-manno-octulosonate cytidylyltransferase [Gammaproteobacteria bacterium]|jgi:3-deoxy-manno-octulosonate cytidylyltransferase (CMP-KDO synthetase)|nr:3-deoxy-manno-octulosonate cytidylyltransferase [Gammaproteobacteria bacterium]MBU2178859.1 3-deoxy-manno-octulosonate cytidylyltransferase [Gammaproteobacteria bacterium]MBU2278851.1 3-deoxy-manno-octulosonate cytidylyltransferase [Gammaproteobacteria bacterium]MBU2428575.1 3-deoxy-manno-octulosonate cytidylyltransferase [Gammaproteobacteria bacterium]
MGFVVVIPARYASSRLPGKPLADIAGKPMIQWVWQQAMQSGADQVVIATDDNQVEQAALEFGATVVMTSASHNSGTERLAEVVKKLKLTPETVVVNVQGDEPFIPPAIIGQVAANLAAQTKARMATLAVPLSSIAEIANPNVVKVVTDHQGYALYFSRSGIPFDRDQAFSAALAENYRRHIGIYAYRAGFIQDYISWPVSTLERIECLEQLRVLWQGEAIHVATALETPPVGVDTPADLAHAVAHANSLVKG